MATSYSFQLFLLCVFSLSLYEKVAADLNVSVPKCCQMGINWQNENLKCHKYPRPVLEIPDSDQELCIKTVELCCEKNRKLQQCQNGIKIFKTENKCPAVGNDLGDDLEKKCCDSCHLGKQLGEFKVPCSTIDIPVEEELKKTMVRCCNEINPAPKIIKNIESNQSDFKQPSGDYDNYDEYDIPSPAPDNLCDLLPGQLCSQICVPTHGSYYCKCEKGYILMEDQKTCTKDTSQQPKQKTTSTIAPQVILPNPEKPVPLHKPKENPSLRYLPIGTDSPTSVLKTTASVSSTTNAANKPTVKTISTSSPKQTCKDVNYCEQECVDSETGVKCECRSGYELDADGKSCKDVNECLNDTFVCDAQTEECFNEIGGYRCIKITTNTTVSESSTPSTTSTVVTPTTQKTQTLAIVPKEKSTGLCPTGFDEISNGCIDIDECNYNKYPEVCDPDHICINTPGSYLCRCKEGFQENPGTLRCEDINECQTAEHNCSTFQGCVNTLGSYQCIRYYGCGTGYTLNSQSNQCEDDDECKLGIDNCKFLGPNYVCRNTLGSFRCEKKRCLPGDNTCVPEKQCPTGYTQNESGNCVDVNECTTGTHNCHPFADVCINRVGGFECRKVIYCPKGFDATANGCEDINECASNTHRCKGLAECKNEKGSYSCVCPSGYQIAQDSSCEDINECNFYMCPYNSECINTPGSYRCDCNLGFRNVNENTCQDIDECSVTPGICQHTCINVFGSFRCTCKTGFRLHENNRTCSDLNECEMFKDQRLCIGECVNIPGSFTCKCPPGYTLGPDGRSCHDIDECLRNPCRGEDEMCLNTRGSYRCNSIKCPANYVKDVEHKNRCKRLKTFCREDDKNCLEQPLTYSFNFITFVSMLPIPPVGHLDLFTMRGPLWSGTNSQFTLELLSARAAQKIPAATKDCFRLRNSGWNQGVISLVKPIPGPQEIELQLTMKIFHNRIRVGSGVAKLLIHVSEFEF